MSEISLPLRIEGGRLARSRNTKDAIDASLSMIISTPLFSNPVDPGFGFIFANLRFEQIDEKDGVVSNPATDSTPSILDEGVYEKKISGNSRNFNTFASDLKDAIVKNEHRLGDVKVTMTYLRAERAIHIAVTGVILETKEDYQFHKHYVIWNG